MKFILNDTISTIKSFEARIVFEEPDSNYFKSIKASNKIYKYFLYKYNHIQYRTSYIMERNSKVNHYFYDLSLTKSNSNNNPNRKFLYKYSEKCSDESLKYYDQYINLNQGSFYSSNIKNSILKSRTSLTNAEQINLTRANLNFTQDIKDNLTTEIHNSAIRDYSVAFKNCFKSNYDNFQSCKDFLWINMESSGYSEIAFQMVLFKSSV